MEIGELGNLNRRDDFHYRWLAAVVLVSTAVALAWYAARHDPAQMARLGGTAGTVFVSKLAIFSGLIEGHPYDPWQLGLIAWVLDLMVTILLLTGLTQVERIPLLGDGLKRARFRAARTLLEYPGLRRTALGGVGLFVFLPLPGSGSVTGTLIARLAGLTRTGTLLSIGVGTGVAVIVYALLAQVLGQQWEVLIKSPWAVLASLLGLVGFVWVAWVRVRRVLKEA